MGSTRSHEPLISVIIPAHYSGSVLRRTLEAFYYIYYPKDKIEMIFSYYSSEDLTSKTIDEFKRDYEKEYFGVKILKCEKPGVSYGRNLGIKTAIGEIIFLLDDDVVIQKEDVFKRALNVLMKEDNIAVVAFPYISTKPSITEKASHFYLKRCLYKAKTFPTGCAMIRRKIFDKVGLFNEQMGYPFSIHEDLELAARIKRTGYDIVIDGEIKQLHLTRKKRKKANQSERYTSRHLLIERLKHYFTDYADSYRDVLKSAPTLWKLELFAFFLTPLLPLIAGILGLYLISAVYVFAICASILAYYRVASLSDIEAIYILLIGRIARSYGYLCRRAFHALDGIR